MKKCLWFIENLPQTVYFACVACCVVYSFDRNRPLWSELCWDCCWTLLYQSCNNSSCFFKASRKDNVWMKRPIRICVYLPPVSLSAKIALQFICSHPCLFVCHKLKVALFPSGAIHLHLKLSLTAGCYGCLVFCVCCMSSLAWIGCPLVVAEISSALMGMVVFSVWKMSPKWESR